MCIRDRSLRSDVSYVEDDLLDWSGNIALLEPSFKEYYSDDVRVGAAPSIEHTDLICTELLDLAPISSPFCPTNPFQLHAFHKSLGDVGGYGPSLDPYCGCLEGVSRKIMWSTFFDYALDFSMAFDNCKRTLTTLFLTCVLLLLSLWDTCKGTW